MDRYERWEVIENFRKEGASGDAEEPASGRYLYFVGAPCLLFLNLRSHRIVLLDHYSINTSDCDIAAQEQKPIYSAQGRSEKRSIQCNLTRFLV